jgi:hypothetical protein
MFDSFARPVLPVLASLLLLVAAGCGGSGSNSGGGGGGGGNDNPPTQVTFTFSNPMPTTVATKIGSGAFAAATLSSGSVSVSLPSGTSDFAIAYACPSQTITSYGSSFQYTPESVVEATVSDGTSYAFECLLESTAGTTGSLAVDVDASSIPGTSYLEVAAHNGQYFADQYAPPVASFTLAAPVGSDEVDVMAYNQDTTTGDVSLTAAKSFDNQTVPGSLNGGTAVVLGAGDATAPENITYSNVPSGFSTPFSLAIFERADDSFGYELATPAVSQYPTMPAGFAQSEDFYSIQGQTYNSTNILYALTTFTTPGPVALSFPAPWTGYSAPKPAALPTFDFSSYTGFSGQTGVSRSGILDWSVGSTAQFEIEVTASSSYLNGSTSVSIPDLSGVTGFQPAPSSGTQANWTALVAQSNAGIAGSAGKVTSNLILDQVEISGSYSVP